MTEDQSALKDALLRAVKIFASRICLLAEGVAVEYIEPTLTMTIAGKEQTLTVLGIREQDEVIGGFLIIHLYAYSSSEDFFVTLDEFGFVTLLSDATALS